MSIIRVKHDKNYVCIHKGALEDPNLSFKAKGLWAYCMSRPDDWEFHVSHLASVSKEKECAIYSALKELKREGYVELTRHREKGRIAYVDYVVREFKNCLPHRGFQDVVIQDVENRALLSNESYQSVPKGTLMKQKDRSEEDLDPPKVGTISVSSFSKESEEIAKELLKQIKTIHPKFKEPKIDKWCDTIDDAIRIDSRKPNELLDAIAWAFNDFFWSKTLQSAEGLRRNYDRIFLNMNACNTKPGWVSKNRAVAHECAQQLRLDQHPTAKIFFIGDKELIHLGTNQKITMEQNPITFEAEMLKCFKLRRNG